MSTQELEESIRTALLSSSKDSQIVAQLLNIVTLHNAHLKEIGAPNELSGAANFSADGSGSVHEYQLKVFLDWIETIPNVFFNKNLFSLSYSPVDGGLYCLASLRSNPILDSWMLCNSRSGT